VCKKIKNLCGCKIDQQLCTSKSCGTADQTIEVDQPKIQVIDLDQTDERFPGRNNDNANEANKMVVTIASPSIKS